MAFVIKNARDHVIHLDGVPIKPGQQLTVQHMTGPIGKALDVGDLQLHDGNEPEPIPFPSVEAAKAYVEDSFARHDIHADVESVEPLSVIKSFKK